VFVIDAATDGNIVGTANTLHVVHAVKWLSTYQKCFAC
jgi:hypothetical protein